MVEKVIRFARHNYNSVCLWAKTWRFPRFLKMSTTKLNTRVCDGQTDR